MAPTCDRKCWSALDGRAATRPPNWRLPRTLPGAAIFLAQFAAILGMLFIQEQPAGDVVLIPEDRTADQKENGLNDKASSMDQAGVLQPALTWHAPTMVTAAWRLFKNLVKQPFYAIYLRRLRAKSENWNHPRHLGIIMDGNRRFARQLGLFDSLAGHQKGADKLHEVLSWCRRTGVRVVTVWSFSLDNFERSTDEVDGLLELFERKAREMAEGDEVHEHKIRVRFIGRTELLPESLQREIRNVEKVTANYDNLILNIAMAYGGREEITDAFRTYVTARVDRGEDLETVLANLDHATLEPHLYTSGQPDPDLILRTSGEIRLSGFMLWQSCHSEFYFCDTNWPAFREIDFLRALRAYDERQRRFGR